MNTAELKQQINKLPTSPGVYIFRNGKAKPLYIGKALNLKNRLKSYLKINDARLQRMISEAAKIDFIKTDSDIEALIMESQYVKKYRPDFNIMLRDDKQYFYVGFTNEQFSKIFITHQPNNVASSMQQVARNLKNHTTYYILHTTDFVGPFTDGTALKTTLRLLRKIFPYCTCRQTHHNYCLNYHINKCLGDCCLKEVSSIKYSVLRNEYKRNIKAIKEILNGKKSILIKQFEKEMKDLSGKQEYEKALELQYKIEKLKRVFKNAQIINSPKVMIYHNQNRILELMQKELKLPLVPHRIEAYDVANIQGKHAVGAMTVFTNGVPDKNEYRKFKIYTKHTPDDTAMLREILTRRFNHPEWSMPDLIIVDGGMAQLNIAKKAIYGSSTSIYPRTIALTKNERHMGYKIITGKKEMLLSRLPVDVKNLLLQIDSEAHRFAISYYRKLHRKSIN